MVAAQRGHAEIVEILLKAGADPKVENEEGHTALELAKKEGYSHIICLLKSLSQQTDLQGRETTHEQTLIGN